MLPSQIELDLLRFFLYLGHLRFEGITLVVASSTMVLPRLLTKPAPLVSTFGAGDMQASDWATGFVLTTGASFDHGLDQFI